LIRIKLSEAALHFGSSKRGQWLLAALTCPDGLYYSMDQGRSPAGS
jgi:hypothetical protein